MEIMLCRMVLQRHPRSLRMIFFSVYLLLIHGLPPLSLTSTMAEPLVTTPASSSSSSSSSSQTSSQPSSSSSSLLSSPHPSSSLPSFSSPLSPSSSARSQSTGMVWQHQPELQDTVTTPSARFMHRYVNVLTRGMCAMACNTHSWCASFFYRDGGDDDDDNDTKTCLLESAAFHSTTDVLSKPGFSYYLAASDWCDKQQGFIFFPGERFCFQVFTEVVTDWHTAQARCRSRGLNLVVPANGQQMALLLATVRRTKDFRKKNNYLGLIRPLDEWDQPWTGGVPTFVDVYNNSVAEEVLQEGFWVTHNPNNQKNNQNCLQIDRKRGNKLNDLWCSYNNYYICQKSWP